MLEWAKLTSMGIGTPTKDTNTPGLCLELCLQKPVQQLKDTHLQSETGLQIALKQDCLSWHQNYWMLQAGTFFLRIFL